MYEEPALTAWAHSDSVGHPQQPLQLHCLPEFWAIQCPRLTTSLGFFLSLSPPWCLSEEWEGETPLGGLWHLPSAQRCLSSRQAFEDCPCKVFTA